MSTAPYSSPDEREARLDRAAKSASAEVVEIGRSAEGRPIRAARVPSIAPAPPRVLLCANIHGPEWIGVESALGFLEALARAEGDPAVLRARAEVWVLPCLNPDGYARTFAREGRGTLAELRTNARGVDLNRNFPRPTGGHSGLISFSGSDRLGSAFYRGAGPLSEPEASALEVLLEAQDFHASASMHSNFGALLPPYVPSDRDAAMYRRLCGAFQRGQRAHHYPRLTARWIDTFTGELEDHQHHARRTWALCVETFSIAASFRQHLIAPSLFWRFNPHDPRPWVESDVPALFAYFLEALELERPGSK